MGGGRLDCNGEIRPNLRWQRRGWNLPYVAPRGDVYTLSAKLISDLYNTDSLQVAGHDNTDDFAYRLMPQVSFDWRYPLVRGDAFN